MAIKSKKHFNGSLKGLFLRYLLAVTTSVILVIMIYVIFITIGLYNGLLLPANEFSNKVSDYEKIIESGKTINLEEVPEEISYAVFDLDGEVEKSTLSDKKLAQVKELIKDPNITNEMSSNNIQKQFKIVRTDNKIYVFEYYISAEFASPVLRKMFPHVEWTLIIVVILLVLADILLVSILFASRLSKKVDYMKQAADKIKDKKLDFEINETGIKEFDAVIMSLDELKENLSESLSSKWKLQQQKKEQMGALAHDIKTPLTVIRGNTDLLLETELSEEQKNYLSYISNNVLRIQEYVRTIIEISKGKLESGKIEDVNIAEFINEIEEQSLPLLKYKDLKLEINNKIQQENISMDKGLCTRALMNLVDNSINYSPEGGTIYFDAWNESDNYYFSIEDEGHGFSNEDLKYATTEFYRSKQNRNMDGHYGMGLFIAKNISEMQGGNLKVENGDRGAKVTFCIKV